MTSTGGADLEPRQLVLIPAALAGAESSRRPYRRKRWFLTRNERTFFRTLRTAISDRYHIFANVRLKDLCLVGELDWKALDGVLRKQIDFVLCDEELQIVAAIELDGWSHEPSRRGERDEFVDRVFLEIGLPFVRFEPGKHADPTWVRRCIENKIASARHWTETRKAS